MSADKISQLDHISDQLGILLSNRSNSVSSGSFWAGIVLTIVTMVATAMLTFGSLQSDVDNHIKNDPRHLGEQQRRDFILNTEHRKEFNKYTLDDIFVSHQELESLIKPKEIKK